MSSRRKMKPSTVRSRSRNKKLTIIGVIAIIIVLVGVVVLLSQPQPPTKVLLKTSMGDIILQLRTDVPMTTQRFKELVEQGKYNGTLFHRVIANFMIQGGGINETLSGIPDEATLAANNRNTRGTVAMANTGQPNSAESQFFINVVDNSGTNRFATFDTSYTVFADVIQGMNIADAISIVATTGSSGNPADKPLQDVTLISAEIIA